MAPTEKATYKLCYPYGMDGCGKEFPLFAYSSDIDTCFWDFDYSYRKE
jgi:hypothetical protein